MAAPPPYPRPSGAYRGSKDVFVAKSKSYRMRVRLTEPQWTALDRLLAATPTWRSTPAAARAAEKLRHAWAEAVENQKEIKR